MRCDGGGGHCDDNDGDGGGEKIYEDILNDWRIIRKDFEKKYKIVLPNKIQFQGGEGKVDQDEGSESKDIQGF